MKPRIQTLKEKAYINIYDLLINNVIKPNEIFNLSDIESHIDMGRSPIRDALNELSKEDILKILPRYGYQVVVIEDKDLHDMINFRDVLECGFLNKNWDLIANKKEIIEELKYDHIEIKTSLDFFEEWNKNIAFHKTLLGISNNLQAIKHLEYTMKKMLRFFVQSYSERWEQLNKRVYTDDHEIIIQSIVDGDKHRAIKHLSEDIVGFKRK